MEKNERAKGVKGLKYSVIPEISRERDYPESMDSRIRGNDGVVGTCTGELTTERQDGQVTERKVEHKQ
ncbi:MAG: hypothetical protein RRA15_12040 [bacterium]|nr:hypothetical protein [bacterium]MDT8367197.1 hypothetical protein [bacterium]